MQLESRPTVFSEKTLLVKSTIKYPPSISHQTPTTVSINHPYFDGLHHPFVVDLGMPDCCFTNLHILFHGYPTVNL